MCVCVCVCFSVSSNEIDLIHMSVPQSTHGRDPIRSCSLYLTDTDMAVQNVIGDSFRGATWVALHNGGGVGW